MENSKDLSNITLAEVLNALQAQEQRRQEETVHGAFHAKAQNTEEIKNKKCFPPSFLFIYL